MNDYYKINERPDIKKSLIDNNIDLDLFFRICDGTELENLKLRTVYYEEIPYTNDNFNELVQAQMDTSYFLYEYASVIKEKYRIQAGPWRTESEASAIFKLLNIIGKFALDIKEYFESFLSGEDFTLPVLPDYQNVWIEDRKYVDHIVDTWSNSIRIIHSFDTPPKKSICSNSTKLLFKSLIVALLISIVAPLFFTHGKVFYTVFEVTVPFFPHIVVFFILSGIIMLFYDAEKYAGDGEESVPDVYR